MQDLATLSSINYLAIVDGSVVLLLLLVVAVSIYITTYYDKLHPNDKTDSSSGDVIETPETYFVNINPFTGITGATMPAITEGNRITKRSD